MIKIGDVPLTSAEITALKGTGHLYTAFKENLPEAFRSKEDMLRRPQEVIGKYRNERDLFGPTALAQLENQIKNIQYLRMPEGIKRHVPIPQAPARYQPLQEYAVVSGSNRTESGFGAAQEAASCPLRRESADLMA